MSERKIVVDVPDKCDKSCPLIRRGWSIGIYLSCEKYKEDI